MEGAPERRAQSVALLPAPLLAVQLAPQYESFFEAHGFGREARRLHDSLCLVPPAYGLATEKLARYAAETARLFYARGAARRRTGSPMKLELLYEMHADLKAPIPVGPGPYGVRMIFDVAGGTVAGPRLRGRVLPSGADWLLLRPDGYGLLDVRAALETDDGAFVYAQYHGFLEMSPAVQAKVAAGGSTAFGDTYFVTQPRFETGDPRYAWLNRVAAVGEGRLLPNAVEYRVYHALPG